MQNFRTPLLECDLVPHLSPFLSTPPLMHHKGHHVGISVHWFKLSQPPPPNSCFLVNSICLEICQNREPRVVLFMMHMINHGALSLPFLSLLSPFLPSLPSLFLSSLLLFFPLPPPLLSSPLLSLTVS